MDHLLDNPVYHALCSGDSHLAHGNGEVKFFDEEVSPFAAFPENYAAGFDSLHDLLPAGRRILFACRQTIDTPPGWELKHFVPGLQFIYLRSPKHFHADFEIVPLTTAHVEEMVALASLTRPGPFNKRTIEFGHYHGVFDHGKLAAMTGQRLHPGHYTEISAVCTHPDHLGRGYAAALLQHQLQIICNHKQVPFLHVRDDNHRAIALYERLGFQQNGVMNFYFLKRL